MLHLLVESKSFVFCNDKKKKNDTAITSIKKETKDSKDTLFYNKIYKLFYQINESNYGDQRLNIYTENKKILSFIHDEGGLITKPFAIEFKKDLFVCFFEVFDGNGNLSKKHIYHFNTLSNKLTRIEIESVKKILSSIQTTDSLYVRKGFLYRNFDFDKSCFTRDKTLPFTLTLFNKSKPEMNNGLEGYKTLKGIFEFKKSGNNFSFTTSNLELIDNVKDGNDTN